MNLLLKHIKSCLFTLAIFLIAGVSGCDVLHDDMSQCDLFLKFKYDYNLDRKDLFAQQVQEVKVFIFDSQGKYLHTFSESGTSLQEADYRMKIPYAMKGCTMVVWAGKTDRFYSLPAMVAGDPIEKLILNYAPENNISSSHLDVLWHSGPSKMVFTEEKGTIQTVSLIRDTNDLTFGIAGSSGYLDISDFDIQIEGANASYDYKNMFLDTDRFIRYCPCQGICMETTRTQTQIHTLRFIKGAVIILSVTDKTTGKKVDIDGDTSVDISNFLLKSKPQGMDDQEYLDRRYLWDISLGVGDKGENGYIALKITINNWTYWFHPTDL